MGLNFIAACHSHCVQRDLLDDIDRYRAALARIRDHGDTHDEPCWALHNGDCADTMQEIARAALDGS